jgi:hypothetical protein
VTVIEHRPLPSDTQGAQDLFEEAHRRRRRRRQLFLGLIALLLVVGLGVLPGVITQPQSAATAFLDQMATLARRQVISLKPGQYYYTEVQTQVASGGGSLVAGGPPVSDYLSGTGETWIAADGSGRQVDTTDPTPQFFTGADRATWMAAGEPTVLPPPPGGLRTVQQFGPGRAPGVSGPIRVYDISHLPTSTAIISQSMALRHSEVVTNCSWLACYTFARVAALLRGPDFGATAARRSALFAVLAEVPGVNLLGTVTDQAGRLGTELQIVERSPVSTESYTCKNLNGPITAKGSVHVPASSVTYAMVVDPKTTTVLSTSESFSSGPMAVLPPCPGEPPAGQAPPIPPNWTLLIHSGIVDSEMGIPG